MINLSNNVYCICCRFAQANGVEKVEYVVLDLTPVNHLDSMGVHLLADLHEEYHEKGIQLLVCNPNPRVLRMLERTGVIKAIGRENVFVRVHDAVTQVKTHFLLESGDLKG
jgi:anti-anti-sigma factor